MWTTPASRGRVVHFADFAGVQAQRLFAHHVLAGLGRGQRRSRWCVKLGVAMITASTSGSAQISRQSVVTRSMPQSLRRRSSKLGSASQAATSSARGSSRMPGHVVIIAHRPGADDGRCAPGCDGRS